MQSVGIVPRHIKRAENYIRDNLVVPLDNETLARVAEVSSRSLYRGFLHFRGMTPARYIQKMRLEEADRLLRSENQSSTIKEIAVATGFGSYASFWRSYVKTFGTPPSKGRASPVSVGSMARSPLSLISTPSVCSASPGG